MLIVTDAQARFSWSFQSRRTVRLTNGEPYYRLEMPEAGLDERRPEGNRRF